MKLYIIPHPLSFSDSEFFQLLDNEWHAMKFKPTIAVRKRNLTTVAAIFSDPLVSRMPRPLGKLEIGLLRDGKISITTDRSGLMPTGD